MGIMVVEGMLQTKQFWPTGTADADTATIQVVPTAFYYKATARSGRKRLADFDGAYVVGRGRAQVIRNGKLSVRLQGIDAPELHYTPTLTGRSYTPAQRTRFNQYNDEYRQVYAETAAAMLGDFVKKLGAEVPCIAETRVERPTDVFDVYGRFVGDVSVRRNGRLVNLNRRVLSQGLALPGFYDSMHDDEIAALTRAYDTGRSRIARRYTARIGRLAAGRVFRKNPPDPTPDRDAGSGRFILPKLFRRQALHYALNASGIVADGFAPWLATQRDDYAMLDDYLAFKKDAERHALATLLNGTKVRYAPEKIVFVESPARLFDARGRYMDTWTFA